MIILSLLGIFLIIIGIIAVKNPTSLFPKIEKTSGRKTESYQITYNPTLTRIVGTALVIMGVFFAIAPFVTFLLMNIFEN